jgi:hypothetical protein
MCKNEDHNIVGKEKVVTERWWQHLLELVNDYSELQVKVEIVNYRAEPAKKEVVESVQDLNCIKHWWKIIFMLNKSGMEKKKKKKRMFDRSNMDN